LEEVVMPSKEFYTIKEIPLVINPNQVIEAHAISTKQIMAMFSNGGKVVLNCSFEEFQFFLIDGNLLTWIYVNGICGSTVMFDPDQIESVEYANPTQCQFVFKNKKKLYVELSRDEMTKRMSLAKEIHEGADFDV
jgi:uncharacterized protein YlzI (FlbEa/FlbD family)